MFSTMRFDENPFSAKKTTKRVSNVALCWPFSSGIMAVKGLRTAGKQYLHEERWSPNSDCCRKGKSVRHK